MAFVACMTGHEKLLRLYNVDKPDSDPFVFPEASGKLRCVAWTKSDDLLFTSDLDAPNITCAPGHALTPAMHTSVLSSIFQADT